MKIKLFFPGIPKPKQSARMNVVYNRKGEPVIFNKNGKKRVLTNIRKDAKVEKYEKSIALMAREQLSPSFCPTDKPIAVKRLIYCFPPVSTLKKLQKDAIEAGKFVAKHTKPDLTDNLSKGIFDALEGIVYLNDSRIFSMTNALKVYGKRPGIYLHLEVIEDENLLIIENTTDEEFKLDTSHLSRKLSDDMPF